MKKEIINQKGDNSRKNDNHQNHVRFDAQGCSARVAFPLPFNDGKAMFFLG